MTQVNPPPNLRLPKKLAQDRDSREYFEKLQFILFQLWTRTGGGTDLIEESITDNITNVSLTSNDNAKLSRLQNRVDELESIDISAQFYNRVASIDQRVSQLIDELVDKLTELTQLTKEQGSDGIDVASKIIEQIKLLNHRAEEAWETGSTIEDIED